jgi:hypothetical protein
MSTVCFSSVHRAESLIRNHKSFKWHGARGIAACSRWRYGENGQTGLECFVADMGEKPTPQHSIDRIDSNGNYEPGNCHWACPKEQAMDRRPRRKEAAFALAA